MVLCFLFFLSKKPPSGDVVWNVAWTNGRDDGLLHSGDQQPGAVVVTTPSSSSATSPGVFNPNPNL